MPGRAGPPSVRRKDSNLHPVSWPRPSTSRTGASLLPRRTNESIASRASDGSTHEPVRCFQIQRVRTAPIYAPRLCGLPPSAPTAETHEPLVCAWQRRAASVPRVAHAIGDMVCCSGPRGVPKRRRWRAGLPTSPMSPSLCNCSTSGSCSVTRGARSPRACRLQQQESCSEPVRDPARPRPPPWPTVGADDRIRRKLASGPRCP